MSKQRKVELSKLKHHVRYLEQFKTPERSLLKIVLQHHQQNLEKLDTSLRRTSKNRLNCSIEHRERAKNSCPLLLRKLANSPK